MKDPELFELPETCLVHAHTRTCWKYNKNECRFWYGRYFTENTIIAIPFDYKLTNEKKKQEVLTWINTLLKQVKSSIDNNLNPAKVNVIHPTKDNFSQPVSVKEILYEILLIRIITEPCPYQQINI